MIWLLVSGVLHLLLLAFPHFARLRGGDQLFSAGKRFQRAEFIAMLVQPHKAMHVDVASIAGKELLQASRRAVGARNANGRGRDDAFPYPVPAADTTPIFSPSEDYYPIDLLTVRPQALVDVDLVTGLGAFEAISGKMILSLWITESGQVARVQFEHSELPESVLQVAENAFRTLRFSPGELNGQKVGSVMRIEVTYDDVWSPGLDEPH